MNLRLAIALVGVCVGVIAAYLKMANATSTQAKAIKPLFLATNLLELVRTLEFFQSTPITCTRGQMKIQPPEGQLESRSMWLDRFDNGK